MNKAAWEARIIIDSSGKIENLTTTATDIGQALINFNRELHKKFCADKETRYIAAISISGPWDK